jgi:hypothetical protein
VAVITFQSRDERDWSRKRGIRRGWRARVKRSSLLPSNARGKSGISANSSQKPERNKPSAQVFFDPERNKFSLCSLAGNKPKV